jgi:ubiquinone/menaquinone biosynthesis C-methylase UbiE
MGRLQVVAQDQATKIAKKRYDRNAPIYDFLELGIERYRYRKWRELLWGKVEGAKILEVGVGTGKSFPYYPDYPVDVEVTAIDFSERMLERAKKSAIRQGVEVDLKQMDVQNLDFADNTFDTVAATTVFCSVPDPVRGLKEVERVCKLEGKVILLEHVLHTNIILGWLMNLANPLAVRISVVNINRRTVDNVSKSGLVVEQVTDLWLGIFKLIEARKR